MFLKKCFCYQREDVSRIKIARRSIRVTITVYPGTVRINSVYKQDNAFTAMFVLQGNAIVSENKITDFTVVCGCESYNH